MVQSGMSGNRQAIDRIIPIQALRLLAAFAVVLTHADIFATSTGDFAGMPVSSIAWLGYGGAGVDLFFVISGFIMVHSSRHLYGAKGARRTFMLRRLIRIVPLYWLATLALLAWPYRYADAPDAQTLVQSLLFIPHAANTGAGRMVPFLEVGWTLNFELLFYLTFAAVLAGSALRTVLRAGAILAVLVAIGVFVHLPLPFSVWTQPILLEFIAGMGLALLHRRGFTLPAWSRVALLLAACSWFSLAGPSGNGLASLDRAIGIGAPAILLLAAAVLGPTRLPAPRWWNLGGDISYALYLFHMPLMFAARAIWLWAGLPFGAAEQIIFIAGTSIASIILSMLVFAGVDRPLTRFLNQRLVKAEQNPKLSQSGV